jgi:AAHS family benzoate transporter-like MFS transporter
MHVPSVSSLVSESKLSTTQLAVFAMCCALTAIDGYDVAAYGAVLPSLMTDWSISSVTAGSLGSVALIGLIRSTTAPKRSTN